MRPPLSAIEPSRLGVSMGTRGLKASACSRVMAVAGAAPDWGGALPAAGAPGVSAWGPACGPPGCACCGCPAGAGGCGFGTKKYCQPNSTPMDRTMARMKLRLFSSMGFYA